VFMRYVHTEDEPIRAAAETVAQQRKQLLTNTGLDSNSAFR
jgi:hypothetical protein